MARRITFFSLFLSIVFGLISGIYKYSWVTSFFFHVIFFILVIFSYRIYLVFEKLGVYLYETYFKQFLQELKKLKEKIENP